MTRLESMLERIRTGWGEIGRPVSRGGAVFTVAVFVTAFLLYLPSSFVVGWDLSTYIAAARDLHRGRDLIALGDVWAVQRAGYTNLLAALFNLPGAFLTNFIIMQTGICALLTTALAQLALRLSGSLAALAVTILWLSNGLLIVQLPVLIDPVWPALALSALVVLLAAEYRGPRGRLLCGVLAGLLAGVALAVKESLIPFAVLPGILWLLGLVRLSVPGVLAFYVLLFATPITLAALAATSLAQLHESTLGASRLGGFISRELDATGQTRYLAYAAAALRGLEVYGFGDARGRGISALVPRLEWVLAALAWLLVGSFRRNPRHVVLLLAMSSLLPLALLAGLMGLRPTQNVMLIGLLYLAAAIAVTEIVRGAMGVLSSLAAGSTAGVWRGHMVKGMVFVLALAATLAIAWPQLEHRIWQRVAKTNWASRLVRVGRADIHARMPDERLASEVRELVPEGSTMIVENPQTRYAMRYFLGDDYQIVPMPLVTAGYTAPWPYYGTLDGSSERQDFLALSTGRPGLYLNVIVGARVTPLMDAIDAEGVGYLVLSGHGYIDPLVTWLINEVGCEVLSDAMDERRLRRSAVLRAPLERSAQAPPYRLTIDRRLLAHADNLAEWPEHDVLHWLEATLADATATDIESLREQAQAETPAIRFIEPSTAPRPVRYRPH